jgi:hypothetical protein
MRRLIALMRLLFWKPRVVVTTPPAWEPNRPKKDGYNWIPVGNTREPVWVTLLYDHSKGGREGRVLIKSAHANREGVIYLDCDEDGKLRRIRADYIGKFVDDEGRTIEPREFLSNRLSIMGTGHSRQGTAPWLGPRRGQLGASAT